MNLKIREMIATLKKYIDGVDLPLEVKRMAVKEAYDEIVAKSEKAILLELEESETDGKENRHE